MATENTNTATAVEALDTISDSLATALAIADLIQHASHEHLRADTLENIGSTLVQFLQRIDLAQEDLQTFVGEAEVPRGRMRLPAAA